MADLLRVTTVPLVIGEAITGKVNLGDTVNPIIPTGKNIEVNTGPPEAKVGLINHPPVDRSETNAL